MSVSKHNIHYYAHVELAVREVEAGRLAGQRVERLCENDRCRRIFHPRLAKVKAGGGRFCCRSCSARANALIANALHPKDGANNPNFKWWASRNKRAYVDRFRAKYPEKARAHDAVKNAVKAHRLLKPTVCGRCGRRPAEPLHAHHADYSKPLDVTFVCRPCHRELDAESQARSAGGGVMLPAVQQIQRLLKELA
jgi:hypothetical protein